MSRPRLRVAPISLRKANELVRRWHRHHPPARGHKYSVAVVDEAGAVRGVAIVGRPVARGLDDGQTLEVARVATDGCDNACSALLAAARRAAFALGYARVITYTLVDESGASLRGAGFAPDGTVSGRSWSCPARARRTTRAQLQTKLRWSSRVAALAAVLFLAACGGGPEAVVPGAATATPAPSPAPSPAPAPPPAFEDGFFSTTRAAGAWAPGSTQIILPSWGDPTGPAAARLLEAPAWAWVSAHHCFGGPRDTWGECWRRTREWMGPLEATGRVLGVFVLDEPLGANGLGYSHVADALAIVRAAGYRTMLSETYPAYVQWYRRDGFRPDADAFGLTAYLQPAAWVEDRMREDPSLSVVFAPADHDEEWEALAKRARARGVFRWSLDLGGVANRRPPMVLEP